MSDPNNCATCDHQRGDTSPYWCYMFREQPEPLCMQHQDRKHLLLPPKLAALLIPIIVAGAKATPKGSQ